MGKSSKTTTGPSKFAKPYIQQGANALQTGYNDNAGNVSNITNFLNGNIPTIASSTLSNPTLAAAANYDQSALASNPDPTTNPLFMKMLGTINGQTADAVNGSIGTRGLAGGSVQTQLLADQIGKADNSAFLTQYNQNIADQQAGATNATAVAGAQNSGIQTLLQYLQGTAELPGQVADQYASGLSGLLGNSTTSTQSQSLGSTLGTVLGAGLSGWASGGFKMASDRRLKTDIVKIHEEPDGLGVYRYRYKAGGPVRTGVMADEVAQIRPWALGPTVGGVATVDYGEL